jgi:hypothetical protein
MSFYYRIKKKLMRDLPQIVKVADAPTLLKKENYNYSSMYVTHPCLSSSRRWDCPCFPLLAHSPCSGSWTGTRAAPPRVPSLLQRRYLSHALRGKDSQCFATDLHVCEARRYSELSPRPSCAHITTKMAMFFQSMLRIRVRDPVPFWSLDSGWENIRIRIRDYLPGSYFRELGNNFLG